MSFSDIKGQDKAVNFLKAAIKNGKISHAYLFTGPGGCGRALLARNFAKALNCAVGDPPCDRCESCKKIDSDSHPDVKWLRRDARSGQIKIEEIRELESQIILKPYEGRYKVFIVEDAEHMNIEASNSFLKTLEEPPQNSVLILISESIKGLLPTVASRCQLIRLNPFDADKLTSILMSEYGMPAKEARFLARFSEGRLGRAVNYGYDIFDWKNSVFEEFSSEECAEDYASEDRGELSRKLKVLAGWYRDLIVYKTTRDENLLINADRIEDIKEKATAYKEEELINILESVLSAKERVENNVNPKLALSVMFKGFK